MIRIIPFLLICTMLMTCSMSPGKERALLDRKTGRATSGGASFFVEDGLACVQSVSDGRIELWAQSPVLSINILTGPVVTSLWSIVIRNVMPGSGLQLSSLKGDSSAGEGSSSLPTVSEWRLELSADDTVRLTIAPDDYSIEETFRFACLSDVQRAVDTVEDIYDRINDDPEIRFVVSSGDLTSSGSSGELKRFQKKLRWINVPFYSTAGNHEMGSAPENWHNIFGRFNSSFEFKGVHFTLVDSGNASVDPLVYDWLESRLRAASDSCHVFVTHYPFFDPWGTRGGSFRSRREAARLLSMLAQADVDLVLHGHIHSYYHYENAGIPVYISGGGGAIEEEFDEIGRHYLGIDADPESETFTVSRIDIDK